MPMHTMMLAQPAQYGAGDLGNAQPDMSQPESGEGDLKRQILADLHRARAQERDEMDKLELEKMTTILQKMLARDQADQEKALGDTGLMRMMRKTG